MSGTVGKFSIAQWASNQWYSGHITSDTVGKSSGASGQWCGEQVANSTVGKLAVSVLNLQC